MRVDDEEVDADSASRNVQTGESANGGVVDGRLERQGIEDGGTRVDGGWIDTTVAGQVAGVSSVLVAVGSTLAATAASPTFSWTGNALSDLGVPGTAAGTPLTALLFNGGLLFGAILGVGFAWYLAATATDVAGTLTGVGVAATVACMAGVGLFPIGTVLHAPMAIAYFLLISVTLVVASIAGHSAGDRSYALTSVALAATNLGVWVGWVGAGATGAVGLAVPEIASSGVFTAWVLLSVRTWPP